MMLEVIDFRPYSKNTLKGFATILFHESGLELRDVAFHDKNGSKWFQLPAKPFDRPDGTKGWNYICAFGDKEDYKKFQELALEALEAFQREARRNENGKNK